MAGRAYERLDVGEGLRSEAGDGDCQVRALCVARGIEYGDAWAQLYELQGKHRSCAFCLVHCLKIREPGLGVVRELSFPAKKGKRRMTPREFCALHPTGRFILKMAHHVAAVVDGVLVDRWNSSSRCVYRAWEVAPIGTHGSGDRCNMQASRDAGEES